MQKQAILYKNNADSTIISVRFTTGGFFGLTKIPITAIGHVGIVVEALLGSSFGQLYQRIINAPGPPEMFAHIEHYFPTINPPMMVLLQTSPNTSLVYR